MTKFLFIRHGQPDYSYLKNNISMISMNSLAFLTEKGVEQVIKVSKDPRLTEAEVLISSPYTRTMQTASILSNHLGLPIVGEINLHEWNTNNFNVQQDAKQRMKNYIQAQQDFNIKSIRISREYESLYAVQSRTVDVLKKYLIYKKVIVVTHAGVIYSQTRKNSHYCDILCQEYDLEMIENTEKTLKKLFRNMDK